MKQFTASNFKGNCTIDDDFESTLIKINEIAQKYNITVHVNSSFRPDANVSGAIVKPATQSNHMIGHAIDCNLMHQGKFYNSKQKIWRKIYSGYQLSVIKNKESIICITRKPKSELKE